MLRWTIVTVKNKKIVSILVMLILLISLLVIFIKQDEENRIIRSNISEFKAFNVMSDINGEPITFVPYGIEILGKTEGLNIREVDTGNPTLIIEVDNNNSLGKGDKEPATLNMVNGSGERYTGLYSGAIEIEGINKPIMIGDKISYEIKLPIETELLGMDPEKDWVLMSMENDETFLRNYLAYDMSRMLGMAFTPDTKYVEVFLNGDYRGTFLLAEKIEIAPNRLNIEKLTPDIISGEGITGGYLMQIDLSTKKKDKMSAPTGKNFYFLASNSNILPGSGERSQIEVRQSKDLLQVHFDYITNYMKNAEEALFSPNFKDADGGFRDYFDEQSFIDWYTIEEIFKNPDVTYLTGPYFYKERWTNIKMGPVSYYDFGAGNSYYKDANPTEGWYVRNTAWYSRMFEDKNFANRFVAQWKSINKDDALLERMNEILDSGAERLKVSARFNSIRWNVTDSGFVELLEPEVLDEQYYSEIEQLRTWLTERIDWIDKNIE